MSEITGTVTDGSSNPVVSAAVMLINTDDWSLEGYTTTDTNGDYSFDTPAGDAEYHVIAQDINSADDYNAVSQPFRTRRDSGVDLQTDSAYSVPDETSVDFTFDLSSDLSGTISGDLTEQGGTVAVPNASIEFKDMGANNYDTDTTDASGQWSADVPDGGYVWATILVDGEARGFETIPSADPSATYNFEIPVYEPSVSSLTPQGTIFSHGTSSITLQVQVDDADLPSDLVAVTFYDHNDSQVGTDTVTSDGGTASTSMTAPSSAGSYSWYAELEDTYDSTNTVTTADAYYGIAAEGIGVTGGAIGIIYVKVQYRGDSGASSGDASLTIENVTTGTVLHTDSADVSYGVNSTKLYQLVDTSGDNLNSDELQWTLDVSSADSTGVWNIDYGSIILSDHRHEVADAITSANAGLHSHPPEPGVIESFSGTRYYPENCDVLINGVPMDVDLGDGTGPFEEVVDLSGELIPGQVNTVEVTSDSLGHVQAFVEGDVYRQILGDG